MSFTYPYAFGLLALLSLLGWPRRQARATLTGNLPAHPIPRSRLGGHSVSYAILTLFMTALVALITDPTQGIHTFNTVEEGRNIMMLIDTSSSMEGEPIRTIKSVATDFIRQRATSDRIGVILFNDVASGGIMTRNHRGLIKELERQTGVSMSGTQLGVGLFKSLASFIEDAVETAVWASPELDAGQRQHRIQLAADEIERLRRHLRQPDGGEFRLQLPDILKTGPLG